MGVNLDAGGWKRGWAVTQCSRHVQRRGPPLPLQARLRRPPLCWSPTSHRPPTLIWVRIPQVNFDESPCHVGSKNLNFEVRVTTGAVSVTTRGPLGPLCRGGGGSGERVLLPLPRPPRSFLLFRAGSRCVHAGPMDILLDGAAPQRMAAWAHVRTLCRPEQQRRACPGVRWVWRAWRGLPSRRSLPAPFACCCEPCAHLRLKRRSPLSQPEFLGLWRCLRAPGGNAMGLSF